MFNKGAKASQNQIIMSKKQAPAEKQVKKPVVSKEMSQFAFGLRGKFLALSKSQQDACVHYFNLYNALGYWWNEVLKEKSREYIDEQIAYARELQVLEQNEGKSELVVEEALKNEDN